MTLKRQEIRISNRISLLLNPNDPDTPAMVHDKGWKHSATYNYACATGELSGNNGDLVLTEHEQLILSKYEDLECQYNDEARKDNPEYQ